jgi:transmembrane sensor
MSDSETSRLTQAAAWRVRLAEEDLEGCPELSAWLTEDPRNAAAWHRVQGEWGFFGEHSTAPEILQLRCTALTHAQEAGRGRWVRSKRFAVAHKGMAVAAGVLLLAVAGLLIWMRQPDVYSTRAGERRVVTLADGSQIALDSRSEVRVRYSAHARELTLAKGQARFDVAHDVERPFSVTADGHKVVATGTSFNVDLFGPSLLVTLIEGHVVVSSLPAFNLSTRIEPNLPRITLDAGEQVVFSPKAPPSVVRVNLGQATAWENGEVIFENDTLTTVVARINRYARDAVIIGDDQTSQLRISGVFHTGDVDGFVSTIVAYLPVRAGKDPDGATRLTHR